MGKPGRTQLKEHFLLRNLRQVFVVNEKEAEEISGTISTSQIHKC